MPVTSLFCPNSKGLDPTSRNRPTSASIYTFQPLTTRSRRPRFFEKTDSTSKFGRRLVLCRMGLLKVATPSLLTHKECHHRRIYDQLGIFFRVLPYDTEEITTDGRLLLPSNNTSKCRRIREAVERDSTPWCSLMSGGDVQARAPAVVRSCASGAENSQDLQRLPGNDDHSIGFIHSGPHLHVRRIALGEGCAAAATASAIMAGTEALTSDSASKGRQTC